MRYLLIIVCYLAFLFCNSSCGNVPGFSDIPEISFLGISKDTINQGLLRDSLDLTIKFRDGDGDLGSTPNQSNVNIILTDSRTNDRYGSFKVPPLDISGAQSGIEGEIIMKVYTTCCIFPPIDSIAPCSKPIQYPSNELTLAIKLIDDSGNESNTITTSVITLLCD